MFVRVNVVGVFLSRKETLISLVVNLLNESADELLCMGVINQQDCAFPC